jgi:D-glycero-alpha-D-manno-heptose-7-phosphate kinase
VIPQRRAVWKTTQFRQQCGKCDNSPISNSAGSNPIGSATNETNPIGSNPAGSNPIEDPHQIAHTIHPVQMHPAQMAAAGKHSARLWYLPSLEVKICKNAKVSSPFTPASDSFHCRAMLFRSRSPLRLGLAGGGTDVSPYCDNFGGCVLNVTIDLHAHCTIEPRSDGIVRFRAADRNECFEAPAAPMFDADISKPLALHKAVHNRVAREFPALAGPSHLACNVTTYSDAPAGSGLGTSSTLTVAMLGAYKEWLKLPLGEYELARTAYEIERFELGLAGGRQDQYASAFGGVNFMEFSAGERVIVNPLRIHADVLNELQACVLLYHNGTSRESAKIIAEQIGNVQCGSMDSIEAMHELKRDAVAMKEQLLRGNIPAMARVLARSWESKKRMASSISNTDIDAVMEAALAAGASAGKVSGAGGGGYIFFMIDPLQREEVSRALSVFPGWVQPCQFSLTGVQTWTTR